MSIIYAENDIYTGPPMRYERIPANKLYIKHFSNKLFLAAILKQPKDFREKTDALRELPIADRKMAYMERHPNFNWDIVRPIIEQLAKEWGH